MLGDPFWEMAPHDVSGRADLIDNGDSVENVEGDQTEIKAHDDAALLVSFRPISQRSSVSNR